MPDTLQELHLGVESMSLLQRGKRETRHTDVMFLTSGRADGVLWLGLPDNDKTRRRVVTGARTRIPDDWCAHSNPKRREFMLLDTVHCLE